MMKANKMKKHKQGFRDYLHRWCNKVEQMTIKIWIAALSFLFGTTAFLSMNAFIHDKGRIDAELIGRLGLLATILFGLFWIFGRPQCMWKVII